MSITTIGLDTSKSVFQIHGVNESGKVELKRKVRRSDLIAFFEKQQRCTVVMEACGAAHHWARILSGLGHTVKLIAPEAVKPFVKKGKKNDAADAAAICKQRNRWRSVRRPSAAARASRRSSLAPARLNRSRNRSSCFGLIEWTPKPRSRSTSTTGPCGTSIATATVFGGPVMD